MCVICISPKGTKKDSDFFLKALKTSHEANTDGAGYAFKRAADNSVYMSKGYKKLDELLTAISSHELGEDDELVVHFRIGNKGAKNVDMMHPFVAATEAIDILANHTTVHHPVLFHNGTLLDFCGNTGTEYSDTYRFVKYFLSVPELTNLLIRDEEEFASVFDFTLKQNRLTILFPDIDKPLAKIGNYKEEEGYFFSNESYKTKGYKNVGGKESWNYGTGREWEADKWNADRTASDYRGGMPMPSSVVRNTSHLYGREANEEHNCRVRNINTLTTKRAANRIKANVKKSLHVDVIDAKYNIIDTESNVIFSRIGGFYVPEKIAPGQEQKDCCKVVINEYNYTELVLSANVKGHDYFKDSMYKIVAYDATTKTHTLGRLIRGEISLAYGSTYLHEDVIYRDFHIRAAVEFEDKYDSYYEYLLDNTPTKTSNKKLLSFLNTKAGRLSMIKNYKIFEEIPRETLLSIAIQNTLFLYDDDVNELESLLVSKCSV